MIYQTNPSTNPQGGEVEKGEVKLHSFTKEIGKNSLPSCVAPVQLDLTNPTVLRPVFDAEILDIPMELLFPHPLIKATYKPKNLRFLMLTFQTAGQLEAIDVVKYKGKYYIVDGMSRYKAAQHLGFESIRVRVLDLTEKQVKALRAHKNVKTKRPLSEQLEMVNLMLESLGSSQGKKRIWEEVIEICDTVESNKNVLHDRFEIARSVMDLEMSAGTLRKAVKVFQFVTEGTEEVKNLKLLEKMDAGDMSIDAAFNLVKNFQKADDDRNTPNALEEIHHQGQKNWFKLFNKSCEDLSDLEDESIQTVIFSPPYWQQRIYTEGVNIDGLKLGEEPTVDLYVENLVRILRNLKRVLKKDGNIFINIAESYKDGDCALVISKLNIAMLNDGWHPKQEISWNKANPKPVGDKIQRFRPSQESILNFSLNRDRYFRHFKLWNRVGQMSLQGGCNDEIQGDKKQKKKKFSLKKPIKSFTDYLEEQDVVGVIQGAVVNKSSLKKIDPEFNHIAPAPDYLSVLPILTTTPLGSTVLDIFSGTSSLLAFPFWFGRNVIGYDTDTESIKFSEKYLKSIMENQVSDSEIEQVQTDYLLAA